MIELLRRFRVVTRLWAVVAVGVLGLAFLGISTLLTAFGQLLEERERGAANVVESAVSVIEHLDGRVAAGELSEAEAREQAAEVIRNMRYNEYADGSREYVWINDLEPRMVMHPTSPGMEGDYLGDYTDPAGNRLFAEAVEVVEADGAGFVAYQWPMPGRDEPVDKSSYVELYEPWGWVVGSGVYVDRGRGEILGFAANFAWQVGIVLLLIAGVVGLVARSIVRPLGDMVGRIRRMTGDTVDLTQRLDASGRDEIAEVASSVNALAERSSSALHHADQAREQLRASTDTLTEAMREAVAGIERQSSETDEVATAMNEMVSTVQEVARNTATAADSAREAEQETSNGRQVVEQVIEAIQGLNDELNRAQEAVETLSGESEEIQSIVGSIHEITEQTNLLALNAAIEAARAGESGRGFSVVAEEVRKLSARTQESTQRIQEIAERFQRGSGDAVSRMRSSSEQTQQVVATSSQAGDSLNAITRSVGTISDLNTQIASAAEEQSSTAEEINRNVTNIRDVANETRTSIEHVQQAVEQQERLVEQLHGELQRIRF